MNLIEAISEWSENKEWRSKIRINKIYIDYINIINPKAIAPNIAYEDASYHEICRIWENNKVRIWGVEPKYLHPSDPEFFDKLEKYIVKTISEFGKGVYPNEAF